MTDRRREKAPRGLILVPTRELAQQVADVLAPLGRSIGVSITTVYGGVSISRQIASVRHADVVVATPGRLIDLLERQPSTLSDIQVTVLDEADHMADLGFMPAVTEIIDRRRPDGQRMFFSATLDRGVGELVTSYISDPALHAVTSSTDSGPAEHRVLVLSAQDKVPVAAEIASRPGRTLFFVRTKHGADRLAKQLSRAGVDAAAIHGDRNQNQRQRALDAFAAGHPRVLIATDVAARGIHVDDVDLVVHSTRRTTTRTTCTVRAARPGPARPAWSSRSWTAARSATCGKCTTRRASPRPATRWRPGITSSGRSPRRARPFRPYRLPRPHRRAGLPREARPAAEARSAGGNAGGYSSGTAQL